VRPCADASTAPPPLSIRAAHRFFLSGASFAFPFLAGDLAAAAVDGPAPEDLRMVFFAFCGVPLPTGDFVGRGFVLAILRTVRVQTTQSAQVMACEAGSSAAVQAFANAEPANARNNGTLIAGTRESATEY
jgi:hypothetical protein